jgi:hypothetical protein
MGVVPNLSAVAPSGFAVAFSGASKANVGIELSALIRDRSAPICADQDGCGGDLWNPLRDQSARDRRLPRRVDLFTLRGVGKKARAVLDPDQGSVAGPLVTFAGLNPHYQARRP